MVDGLIYKQQSKVSVLETSPDAAANTVEVKPPQIL
jgi:hypothetical protein